MIIELRFALHFQQIPDQMKPLIAIAALMVFWNTSIANPYKLDESDLIAKFDQSTDISAFIATPELLEYSTMVAEAKSESIAAIIAFGSLVAPYVFSYIYQTAFIASGGAAIVGYPVLVAVDCALMFPWHRFYLGTGGQDVKVGLLYCVTLDWCGLLPLIDGIMLLIDDGSTYIDNPKYLMWTGN